MRLTRSSYLSGSMDRTSRSRSPTAGALTDPAVVAAAAEVDLAAASGGTAAAVAAAVASADTERGAEASEAAKGAEVGGFSFYMSC